MKKGFMSFTDLSVTATPNYRHRLRFGVLTVDGLNGTFATKNTSFQCACLLLNCGSLIIDDDFK